MLSLLGGVSVAVGQMPSHVLWTVSGPASAPTVTLSPDGKWLGYVSVDGVRLLEAKSRKQVNFWPAKASGNRAPVISFAPDGSTVYVLSDPALGEVTAVNLTNGAVKLKSSLFPAGSEPVRLFAFPNSVAAVMPTQQTIGGVPNASLEVRSYSSGAFRPLFTKTLTHPNSLLPWRFAYGTVAGKEQVYFFNQSFDVRAGTLKTLDYMDGGVTFEPWTVGVDPEGGLIQQVAKKGTGGYEIQGFRRVTDTVKWDKSVTTLAGDFYIGPMQFAKLSDGTGIGLMGTGDGKKLAALKWSTGDFAFQSDLGTSGKGLEFSDGMTRPDRSDVWLRLATLGATPAPKTARLAFDANGAVTESEDLSPFVGGFRQTEVANGYVVALSVNGAVVAYDLKGNRKWSIVIPGARYITEPSGNGRMLITTGSKTFLVDSNTGASVASTASGFKWLYWYGDSQFVGVRDDGRASVYAISNASIVGKFTVDGFGDAAQVSVERGYIVGAKGTELKVVWPATRKFQVIAIDKPVRSGPHSIREVKWGMQWIYDDGLVSKSSQISYTNSPDGFSYGPADNFDRRVSFWRNRCSQQFPDGWVTGLVEISASGASSASLEGTGSPIVPSLEELQWAAVSNDFYFVAAITGSSAPSTGRDLMVIGLPYESGSVTTLGSGLPFTLRLSRPARPGGERLRIEFDKFLPSPIDLTVPAGKREHSLNYLLDVAERVRTNGKITQLEPEAIGKPKVLKFVTEIAPALCTVQFGVGPIVGGIDSVTMLLSKTGISLVDDAVHLVSSAPGVLSVPSSLAMGGMESKHLTLPTSVVNAKTSVLVTATVNHVAHSDMVTILPPYLKEIAIVGSPAVNGAPAQLTANLRQAPPASGIPLKLKLAWGAESREITVNLTTVTQSFTIPTPLVSEPTALKVIATTQLSEPSTVTVDLKPAILSRYLLNSTTVVAGQKLTGTLKLNAPAGPNDVITLTSSSSRLTVPATVKVTPGSDVATFELTTTGGAKTAVIITATLRGVTLKKTVTMTATP